MRFTPEEASGMAEVTRHHPGIGDLRWVENHDAWEGTVELMPGVSVAFDIVAEAEWATADPAELFEAGAAFLTWAREFEPQCRERVADDLLDLYNDAWADDDPEEGPPRLSRAEFLAAIRPSGLSLYSSGMSSWSYDAGDLFAGHGIWVVADKDGSFKGKASLVG
jgi:hypothetical protein